MKVEVGVFDNTKHKEYKRLSQDNIQYVPKSNIHTNIDSGFDQTLISIPSTSLRDDLIPTLYFIVLYKI